MKGECLVSMDWYACACVRRLVWVMRVAAGLCPSYNCSTQSKTSIRTLLITTATRRSYSRHKQVRTALTTDDSVKQMTKVIR